MSDPSDVILAADDLHRRTDVVRGHDLERLAAALDLPLPRAGIVPPLWHWTSYLDRTVTALLGDDGHPRAGGLVVTPPHPRRMFAGARLTWHTTLPADVPLERVAQVTAPVHKDGRAGPMAFITVRLRYLADGTEVALEEQDLVYLPGRDDEPVRPDGRSGDGTARPLVDSPVDGADAEDEDSAVPALLRRRSRFDAPVLFRFSALTYNTHRIHYDAPYVTDVEGYPGLVVHGPLLALELAELVRTLHGDEALEGFAFRARSPAFAGELLTFEAYDADADAAAPGEGGGRVLALIARRGATTLMTATARLRRRRH